MRLNFNAYFTNCLWSRVDGWAGPSIFRNIWYAWVYISVAAALKQIDFFLGIYGMPYWPSLLSVLGFPDSGTKQPDFGVRWLYWGAPSEGAWTQSQDSFAREQAPLQVPNVLEEFENVPHELDIINPPPASLPWQPVTQNFCTPWIELLWTLESLIRSNVTATRNSQN